MNAPSQLELVCPACETPAFEVRALREEGLATAQCVHCKQHFLLFDSEDHWFDAIQRGYPRTSRCRCRESVCRLRAHFDYRETGEVRWVGVERQCPGCGTTAELMDFDVKYGDTDQLIHAPLRPCAKPKILVRQHELSLFATGDDIARVLCFLADDLHCNFVARLFLNGAWAIQPIAAEDGVELVRGDACEPVPASQRVHPPYFSIFAGPGLLPVDQAIADDLPRANAYWKRFEIIELKSPTVMVYGRVKALLYYINFSNEYIVENAVQRKSAEFLKLTNALLDWLAREFVSWRGRFCFDNPDENVRAFGEKFRPGR